jgi:hypothetical protein
MVDQGDDSQSRGMRLDRHRHPAHRQPVDHHASPLGYRRERIGHGLPRDFVGVGKATREVVDAHAPAALPQAFDHVGVVDVATRHLIQRPGHDDVQLARCHGVPS